MARFFFSSTLLLICAVLLILTTSSSTVSAGGEYPSELTWNPAKPTCQGSIAECLAGEEEFDLDSEINRRILATSNYISYGALKRNTVPCSRRGSSYYNCQSGAQANPYNRGCSNIARCRS